MRARERIYQKNLVFANANFMPKLTLLCANNAQTAITWSVCPEGQGIGPCVDFMRWLAPRKSYHTLRGSRPRTTRSEHVLAFWGRRMRPSTHRAQSRLRR